MIPLATTTISVYRPTPAAIDAEPYTAETNEQRIKVASRVRSAIGAFSRTVAATEYRAGGALSSTILKLTCDIPPSGVDHNDYIIDETTGVEYQVNWAFTRIALGLDHITAEIQRIEGAR